MVDETQQYSAAEMERMMKVQDVLLKAMAKKITWWAAAEILGVPDRTMRRWRERLEKGGYAGLADRRKGKPSAKRIPLATVEKVLGLYQETYYDLNIQHFHEKLGEEHGIQLSYTWVQKALQGAGLVAKRHKRGPHRLGWLLLAARTAPKEHVTAAAYASTSVLILMPLVWEATVRFHAISCWTAAWILFLFSAFGLALSWRKFLSALASIAVMAGVLTSLALLVATHDLAPFTLELLGTAAAVELSACLGHALALRWFVACAADLAVLLLTYFLTRAEGLPEGYAAIPLGTALAAQVSLLFIFLSSTTVRTVFKGYPVTTFETIQWLVAFVLSVGGALRLAHGNPTAVSAISIMSLGCGAACYVISFAFLARAGKRDRNFYTYTTFGLLLVFGGSRLLVSAVALALVLSILSLACLLIGRESGRMTLKWHGTIYLLSATVLSGLGGWTAAHLLPTGAVRLPLAPAAGVAAVAAILGYALGLRPPEKIRKTIFMQNCFGAYSGHGSSTSAYRCSQEGSAGAYEE